MNTLNSGNAATLTTGNSILTSVRAINKVKGQPDQGKILQIEVIERLVNKSNSPLAEFNPNDSRIGQSKPQRAWINIEPQVLFTAFNITDTALQQRINNLTVSTGLPVEQRTEGVHFINLNILNPTFQGEVLRVQITETTVRPNEQTAAKINPSTNKVITFEGSPVYRTANVVKGEPKNVLLTSDVAVPVTPPVAERKAMQPNSLAGATN